MQRWDWDLGFEPAALDSCSETELNIVELSYSHVCRGLQ